MGMQVCVANTMQQLAADNFSCPSVKLPNLVRCTVVLWTGLPQWEALLSFTPSVPAASLLGKPVHFHC